MSANKLDLEVRAEALLNRLEHHNLGLDPLSAWEVRSLLQETLEIGKLCLEDSLTDGVLARVERIMQQAIREACIAEAALKR